MVRKLACLDANANGFDRHVHRRFVLALQIFFAIKLMPPTPFEELQRLASESGVEKSLDFLEHHFRRDKEYFKLFEVLKMRCRHQLGLPLIYSQQPDELDETQQRILEDKLLAACREIGTLFFKSGQIQEGWMYLQPIGDKSLNEKLARSVVPDEENMDALIDITVSQGAAPVYGFGLLLKHYGTCNGITTFDTQATRFDPATRSQMARELLNHIYDELAANVNYAIGQGDKTNESGGDSRVNQQAESSMASLADLMAAHPDLTKDGAHHIDTTHLASVMRIARLVDDPEDLRKAHELANYGSQLHEDFQYPGNPPFEDTFVDHGFFFGSLLGHDVDRAVAHFQAKMQSLSADEFGPVAEETLVDLLVRLGRNDEAITILTERVLGKYEPLGIAPPPFEIARTPEALARLREFYKAEGDLLGFAVSVLNRG